MRGAVYVNGRITGANEAVIPVYDHGFVYGEGIYETLRTYNRVPFLYDRHMRRLRHARAPYSYAAGRQPRIAPHPAARLDPSPSCRRHGAHGFRHRSGSRSCSVPQ